MQPLHMSLDLFVLPPSTPGLPLAEHLNCLLRAVFFGSAIQLTLGSFAVAFVTVVFAYDKS